MASLFNKIFSDSQKLQQSKGILLVNKLEKISKKFFKLDQEESKLSKDQKNDISYKKSEDILESREESKETLFEQPELELETVAPPIPPMRTASLSNSKNDISYKKSEDILESREESKEILFEQPELELETVAPPIPPMRTASLSNSKQEINLGKKEEGIVLSKIQNCKGSKETRLVLEREDIDSLEKINELRYLKEANTNINEISFAIGAVSSKDQIEALGEALKGSNIDSLDFHNNSIDTKDNLLALGDSFRDLPIKSLTLSNNGIDTEDKLLSLGKSLESLPNITSLDLSGNQIDSVDKIGKLGSITKNLSLSHINLANNNINSKDKLKELTSVLAKKEDLLSLDISANDIFQNVGVKQVVSCVNKTNIENLTIQSDSMNQEDNKHISDFKNTKVKFLDVQNSIKSRDRLSFIDSIVDTNIECASLSISEVYKRDHTGDEGLKKFENIYNKTNLDLGKEDLKKMDKFESLSYLKDTNVREISFEPNSISLGDDIKTLGAALKGSKIKSLDFSNGNIDTREKVQSFGEAFKDTPINKLGLSNNKIDTVERIEELSEALKDKPVKALDLSGNKIDTVEKIEELGKALKGLPINSLKLSNTGIDTEEKLSALASALEGLPVSNLDISDNDLSSPKALSKLSNIVEKAPNLSYLDLSNTSISTKEQVEALGDVLHLSKLNGLNVSNNKIDTKEKIEVFGRTLKGSTINTLDMSENGIETKEAIDEISESVLKSSELQNFSFRGNQVSTKEKLDSLQEGLKGAENLVSLDLSSNNILSNGNASEIIKALKGSKLRSLAINNDTLTQGEDSVNAFKGLADTNVRFLDVQNSIDSSKEEQLTELLSDINMLGVRVSKDKVYESPLMKEDGIRIHADGKKRAPTVTNKLQTILEESREGVSIEAFDKTFNNRVNTTKIIEAANGSGELSLEKQDIKSLEQVEALGFLKETNVKRINFSNCIDSSSQIETLGQALEGSRVGELDFSTNKINTVEKIQSLGKAFNGLPVNSLDVSNNSIDTEEKILALGVATKGLPLSDLKISGNSINTEAKMEALKTVLRSTEINNLDLSNNHIETAEVLKGLRGSCEGLPIRSLSLSGNNLKGDNLLSLEAISDTLPDLTKLDLSNGKISTKEDIKALGEVIKSSRVKELNLSGNNINSKEAIEELARVIKDSRIQSLDLSRNGIETEEAAKALGDVLEESRITNLNISHNNMAVEETSLSLGESLKRGKNLTDLDISHNNVFQEAGSEKFVDSIKQTNIESLKMNHNMVSEEDVKNFSDLKGSKIVELEVEGSFKKKTVKGFIEAIKDTNVSSLQISKNIRYNKEDIDAYNQLIAKKGQERDSKLVENIIEEVKPEEVESSINVNVESSSIEEKGDKSKDFKSFKQQAKELGEELRGLGLKEEESKNVTTNTVSGHNKNVSDQEVGR